MKSSMIDLSNEDEISDDINIDIDFFDDDSDEKLKEIHQNIQSITSVSFLQDNENVFTSDPKMCSLISCREYDEMEQEAIKEVKKYYYASLANEMAVFQQNQMNFLNEFNTEDDDNYINWEISPENLSEQEIQYEISKLQKKLSNIKDENRNLKIENEKNSSKLQLICDQNEKLKEMKIM